LIHFYKRAEAELARESKCVMIFRKLTAL